MVDRVVKVKLSAQVSEYQQGMLEAARATKSVGTEAERLSQQKEAFNQLGGAALTMGAGITAATALSVKAAMEWESAWAGVTKTVDGSDAQMTALEQSLRDLTGVLPASHTEIAAVAEAAGQLGIETENVAGFTRTMIDLGETTNLSANDAATALARFTNIMGTSQDEVSNLGSALVGLGNNYATTEAEITEMGLRLAGAGRQIGLSEGDVLGLSTALSSVGIEAEAGGSAFSKVMIDIAASVEEGGERLDMFAKAAGMSADDFARQWRDEPSLALASFVKGLANAEAQGSSTLGVLAELGITEVRMRDALLRSSAAADMFAGAMAKGNEEFEANNALTEEAAKRYETVEARLAIAGNAIRDAAIEFGEVFLPAVGAAADGVADFSGFIGDLPDPVKGLIGILGGGAGVFALVGGAALIAVPKIVEFKIAMETLGVTGAGMRGKLSSFIRFLGGPWGVAMLAATAATLGFNKAIEDGLPSQAELTNKAKTSASAMDLLAAAAERGQFEMTLWGDYTDGIKELPDLLDRAADAGWRWADLSFNDQGSLDSIKRLGDAFGELAATDLPRAQEQFAGLVEQFDLTDEQAQQLLREMPAFRDVLLDQATAAGIAADDNALLEMALGGVKDGSEGAADSAQTAADAYLAAADEASALDDQLQTLIDTINESNGVGQDAVSANADYRQSLADIKTEADALREKYEEANGSLDGFKLSLDESTASGSTNAAMLADVAGKAQDAALAQYEVDKRTMSAKDATDKYASTLAAQRDAFVKSAVGAGYNADEVQKLADKVFALPSEKEIDMLVDTANAQGVINRFIWANDGRRINLIVDGVAGRQVHGSDVTARANGGIEAYANGGFPTGIYQGRPGGIHKFAEPETGWEAYISGKADQRDRNIGLWVETGRRLGVDMAGGGGGGVQFPDTITLVDADGSILTKARVIAGDAVAKSNAARDRSLRGRLSPA